MRVRIRDERGVALIVSLIGIVMVGALVTGVFASGYVEQRTGENTRSMERAFAVAEYGLSETIAQWNILVYNRLNPGEVLSVSGTVPGGTGAYTGTVRRLNGEQFLIDITGRETRANARQRLGSLTKLRPLEIDIQAALTTRGTTRVGGSARVDASDHLPVGWTGCPPLESTKPGVRIPEDDDVEYSGSCAGGTCVTGVPKVLEDVTVDDGTFFDYGDLDWDALTAMATKPLPTGSYTGIGPTLTADGKCDVANPSNWGAPFDPLSPCANYFPIVYVPGNLSISGGRGQGLLLVEGDLQVQGGYEHFGVVIVKGNLKTTGTGGHFTGGVLAANVDLDQSSVLGDAIINYSSCAIAKAISFSSPGAPLRSRAWLQLY